jgi:hypothetical protein
MVSVAHSTARAILSMSRHDHRRVDQLLTRALSLSEQAPRQSYDDCVPRRFPPGEVHLT